jgi:hypothetical protein
LHEDKIDFLLKMQLRIQDANLEEMKRIETEKRENIEKRLQELRKPKPPEIIPNDIID